MNSKGETHGTNSLLPFDVNVMLSQQLTTLLDGTYWRVSMGWWHLRLSAKILAPLRLSVNFFSVTVNSKVKN